MTFNRIQIPEPKRKPFQIHLSTAIVLMFVAGGLIWRNVEWRVIEFDYPVADNGSIVKIPNREGYGWPMGVLSQPAGYLGDRTKTFDYFGLIADLLTACSVQIAVWSLCEWLIRRDARKRV